MTPTTTLTVRPHELEPGGIIVDHLGQRVGGYDPPSLLFYDGRWWVWSSLDKLICVLPGDAEVEVLRADTTDVPEGGLGSSLEPSPLQGAPSGATPDDGEPGEAWCGATHDVPEESNGFEGVYARQSDSSTLSQPSSGATSDDWAPPHGITRVRGQLVVVR